MFITFEGPEGSGKTSQLPALATYLEGLGYKVVCTREPGGTAISDQIREVLTSMKNQELHPRTEILLFLAARAQLVEQVIKPALEVGKIVLCDRYGDSTLAYQGYGHGLDLKILKQMLEFATDHLTPDLTLLLDLEVEDGLARKKKGAEWNRLDAYALAFHKRVLEGYHQLIAEEPKRWVTVDATQDIDTVQAALRKTILKKLKSMHVEP
jgi:dTMP kinase